MLDEQQDYKNGYHYYRLTATGGAAWEAFAAPDWTQYCTHWLSYEDDKDSQFASHTIQTATKEVLDDYLQSFIISDPSVEQSTLKYSAMSAWQATYWKQLPQGYKATFQRRESNGTLSFDASCAWQEFQRSLWYRWR